MATILSARIVEPEETVVARKLLCKHVSTATRLHEAARDTNATIEKLLEGVFSVGSVQRL
jgi:hypothetical protein